MNLKVAQRTSPYSNAAPLTNSIRSKKKAFHCLDRYAKVGKGTAKKDDVGRIRTYAPEGTRFLVLRDNHSATTPMVVAVVQLL